jgi:hypothetical protein
MAKCANCKKSILFGGKSDGERRYCNQKCLDQDVLRETSELLPQELVDARVNALHRGRCPQCKNDGPIDVHQSYSLWTFVYFTQLSTRQHVCCRSCARGSQFWAIVRSGLFGWWGPIGIVMTPVQILRNVAGMLGGPPPYAPSAPLNQLVRRMTAEQVLANPDARHRAAGLFEPSPSQNMGEDQRSDDRGVRLDDVLGSVGRELPPRDLLVGHRS